MGKILGRRMHSTWIYFAVKFLCSGKIYRLKEEKEKWRKNEPRHFKFFLLLTPMDGEGTSLVTRALKFLVPQIPLFLLSTLFDMYLKQPSAKGTHPPCFHKGRKLCIAFTVSWDIFSRFKEQFLTLVK